MDGDALDTRSRPARPFGGPPVTWRLPLWPIVLFYTLLVGGLLTFFGATSFHRTVTVSGELAPTSGVLTVTARRDGIVSEVFVRNGTQVKAGAPVLALSVDTSLPGGQRIGGILAEAADAKASSLASQASADFAARQDSLDDIAVRRRAIDEQLALLAGSRNVALDRISQMEQRIASAEPLVRKGYISGLQIQQWRDSLSANRLALAEIDQRRADAARQRGQLGVEERQLTTKSLQDRSSLASARAELLTARASAMDQNGLLLTAQRPGRVTSLRTKPGAAVRAGEPLATILPSGSRLQAEVLVPSRSIGFVRPGETVTLMLDAFPYQTFGTTRGRVAEVSSAPVAGPAAGPGAPTEPLYSVLVDLEQQSISAYGRSWPLLPGMKADAVILLERRSILAWLLDPFLAFAKRPRG